MTESLTDTNDPYKLERFVAAQAGVFEQALSEVRNGQKVSHWMWYIFPQLRGLGQSETALRYGILNLAEARAYLEHPMLGPRLIAISQAALSVNEKTATEIFGKPDDMKLRSCATLFAEVTDVDSVFQEILDKYFGGNADPRTIQLLRDE